LEAGNAIAATQAYEFAAKIDPSNQKASDGLRKARNLDRVLPLLADAQNAEAAKNFPRAAKAYNDVLAIEPNNVKARAGVARTNSASGADSYDKAIGTGFAALGAGRLEEARAAFGQARAIRPTGREAAAGLDQVNAATRARGYSAVRLRASSLESEERWGEALDEYEAVLKNDPSLVFAQQGRQRAASRKDLADRLQFLIDEPQRLAAPAVRSEALHLLDMADAANPSGPVLRSQMARLQILLPEFDKPVRLALESDNTTQVAIQRVGSFGTFARREIELKPGKYTVVGTRAGYRDVRRDVTVAPGQDVQIISIRCLEPI
jgi:tetratricopeptide (TPR) repeat protein